MTVETVEFFTPEILTDPYAFYEWSRVEAPVLRTHLPGQNREVYIVTSFALVKEVLGTPSIYSSEVTHVLMGGASHNPGVEALLEEGFSAGPLLLNLDEPDHQRYRAMFNPIFSPRQVSQLAAAMAEIMDELIDKVATRGSCDFINEIAVPFPLFVICDLLGFDRGLYPEIKRWTDAVLRRVGQQEGPEAEIATMREILEFHRFIRAEIADRRADPKDDLVTEIVQARVSGVAPLTGQEALLFIQELSVAGNETTRNTLIGGMTMLLQQPDLAARLRAEPALIPAAVEEMLRLFTPVTGTWRITTQDTTLGGVPIAAGTVVMVRMESANRDPAQFPNPEMIDVARQNRNTQLSFSYGVHYCLGSMLARRELVIAVGKILTRLHNPVLVEALSDLGRPPSVMLRGNNALHIGFDPAPVAVPA
jgi:cytochrome P450